MNKVINRLALILPLAIFVIIAGVALVLLDKTLKGERDTRSIGLSMVGKPLPETIIPLHNSTDTLALADMKGSVFAVNIFASWCEPCKLEATVIAELAKDIPIIGVNYRDKAEDADRFLERFGNPYEAIGRDSDGSISIKLGAHGLPETFIIDGDGVIVLHHQGPVFASDLKGAVATAISDANNKTPANKDG